MRRMRSLLVVSAVGLTVLGRPAVAQWISNPARWCEVGGFEAEANLSLAKVAYEDTDITRTTLGVETAYGMTEWFDVYGVLGGILSAEPEDWDGSGSGFLIGAGTRGILYQRERFTAMGYGQLQYINEDYGETSETTEEEGYTVSAEVEGSILELVVGAVGRYEITDCFSAYGGLEVIPFSDGEAEASYKGSGEIEGETVSESLGSDSEDVSRDNRVGLRMGAVYDWGGVWVRGDLVLISEQSVTIGAGVAF